MQLKSVVYDLIGVFFVGNGGGGGGALVISWMVLKEVLVINSGVHLDFCLM